MCVAALAIDAGSGRARASSPTACSATSTAIATSSAGALALGSALAFLVPLGLELTGVLDRTWTVGGDALTIVSPGIELSNAWASVLLVTANLALIFVNVFFGRSVSLTRHHAQRSLAIQAWHLRQLLPG